MNKTALITGASSGIGLELAKLFSEKGYNLVLISQNENNLSKAKEVVREAGNNISITTVAIDLAKEDSAEEIYRYTKEKAIEVDVLVNNAGIQVYGNFHEISIEDTMRLMYINMLSVTKLTRLFTADMVRRGSGKVLNLGSTGSFQPVPLNAAYCASKAFVLYLSEGVNEELKGTGVTVTTLCPGATRTNFAKRANIEDIKLFSGNLLEAQKVAWIGYKALMKGKPVVIAGLYNKLLATSIRFTPRKIVTALGMKLMQKK